MKSITIKCLAAAGTYCALASASVSAGPQDTGSWSPVLDWPNIAIHSVLTPQGKIMSFGTDEDGVQGAQFSYDVWDPALGTGANSHNTLPNTLGVDSFCSAAVLIPETGNILMAGGDDRPNGLVNSGINDAPIFNTQTNSLSRAANMNSARWYPTSTVLANGEILLSGGRDNSNRPVNTPEIYSPSTNKWRSLLGISTDGFQSDYPRQWVAPNGKVFGYFSGNRMFSIDPTGSGSIQLLDNLPTSNKLSRSSAVMYRSGKILHVGGINADTNTTLVIDINGSTPSVRAVNKPTEAGRVYNTSVVLPNGKVVIVGGSKVYNELNGTSYRPEIWDPATEAWSLMAPSVKARLYHSTALLLKDGRILVAGGGAPGPQVNTNAEIFSPPYLFNNSGQTASRPNIVSAPTEAPYGSKIAVRHNPNNVISRATLIKTGAVTHSINMEQRFIELDFKDIHNGVSVTLPNSPNLAPPGYYLLHLLDDKGVPSVAHIIRISRTAQLNIGPYPVALADSGTTRPDRAVTLNVLANDTGNGKGLVEVNNYSQKGGRPKISGNRVVYTPKAGFSGTDTFWYVMEDDQGRTNSAKVTISVTSLGSAYPTGKADTVTATGSGRITIDVLANDTGNSLTLNAPNAWSQKGGNVALSANKLTYKPKAGFNGTDKIWYTFKDSQDRSNSSVVNITVSGNNGTSSPYPTASEDNVTTPTATSTTIDALANDSGNGLVLNAPNAWSLKGGRVSLVDNKLVYQSKTGFTGSDKIWYTFKDSQGRSNNGQVNITVVAGNANAFPVANSDNFSTPRNTAKTLDILANDTASGGIAIDTLYAYSAKGGKTSQSNGKVLYTPKTNFTGEDNFWYVMIDGQGRKNSAQVKINVTP